MAERRLHGLQRVLGTNALSSTAYGNVGSTVYYALGLVAALALGLTPVVFVFAGFLFFCTAATYAEATAMFPEAGGASSFARRGFNEVVSFVAAWAQVLAYVLMLAIAALFVPHYLGGVFWEPLRSSPGDVIAGIAIVAVLVAVNVRGAKGSSGPAVLVAAVDFLTQVLIVGLGVFLVLSPDVLVDNVDLGSAPGWKDLFLAVPIALIALMGIETVANMAEEARDGTRTIPQALTRVQVAVLALSFTLPAVALSALPVGRDPETGDASTLLGMPEDEGGFAGEPVLGIVKSIDLGFMDGPAEVYVALLATVVLLLTANAGLLAATRLVGSMGTYRQLPEVLSRSHTSRGTPWVALVVFGALACIALLPGRATWLANVFAFAATLSFTVAHLSIIALRRRFPTHERPYSGPVDVRLGGVAVPLLAVLGGLGTAIACVVVTVLNLEVIVVGVLWFGVGGTLYVAHRRREGLDLANTSRLVMPAPVVDHEAAYESVLVALDDRQDPSGAIAMAKKLAAPRRRGIHVLVTITVPASSPIETEMPDRELAAQALIEHAKLHGGRRVTGHYRKVRAGQAGRAIVDEARELKSKAIVMTLPVRYSAATGTTVFGKTVETVLAERPCRVIIHSGPSAPGGARPVVPNRSRPGLRTR
jgi:APA family basic amino acid/polyamine antiporter